MMTNDNIKNSFNEIINAVEFFSQRFDLPLIHEYALTFTKHLLKPKHYTLIIQVDDDYKVIDTTSEAVKDFSFEVTPNLRNIVMFHAGLFIPEDLHQHLPSELIEHSPFEMGIPLIMDKYLHGFILLDFENIAPQTEVIALTLMNLYSNSLTSYDSYNQLLETRQELDEKIFNLFAINQSSKALLSTLNIEEVYELSVSIFSELTQSSITSLFLYQPETDTFNLQAINNVYSFDDRSNLSLYLEDNPFDQNFPSVLNLSNKKDYNLVTACLANPSELAELVKPKLIILIRDYDKLLGFITIGERINNNPYDDSIFELLESLGSSLFTSLQNAKFLSTIEQQRQLLNDKLNRLVTLNALMKNINGSSDLDSLTAVTLETINVSFNANCACFLEYSEETNEFVVINALNISSNIKNEPIKLHKQLRTDKKENTIILNSSDEVKALFGNTVYGYFEDYCTGVMIIPLYLDNYNLNLLGALCVFNIKDRLISDEESQLTFETICNHITPVWHQLESLDQIKKAYIPDYTYCFKEKLMIEIDESNMFNIDLFVVHIAKNGPLSLNQDRHLMALLEQFDNAYLVDYNHLLLITDDRSVMDSITLDETYTTHLYKYKEDFTDIESFQKALK